MLVLKLSHVSVSEIIEILVKFGLAEIFSKIAYIFAVSSEKL